METGEVGSIRGPAPSNLPLMGEASFAQNSSAVASPFGGRLEGAYSIHQPQQFLGRGKGRDGVGLDEEQGKARGHEGSHDESLLVGQLARVAELQRLACGLQHESALPLVRQSEDGEAVHFWRTI